MKKRPPFNQEMAIRGANRRLFARSPLVQEKQEESRQEFPRFKKDGTRAKKNWVKRQCEVCTNWVSSTKIAIDHIDPVVPPDGFPAGSDMWERITIFLKRLWCDKTNLQRICDVCHQTKTDKERFERNFIKDKELIWGLEMDTRSDLFPQPSSYEYMKKKLTKFTPKKLSGYPQDFQDRVIQLKDLVKSIKPSTRPNSKENK